MSNGYISIADTKANPLMDEFILNFDYLKSTGSINEYQSQFIKEYEGNSELLLLKFIKSII